MLPPVVNIVTGWNFVPVLDLTGDLEAGATSTATGAGSYTASLEDVARIWTFNTISNRWVDVTTGDMAIGRGYWLYSRESGTLVP